jgi:hypothetical protein
VSVTVMVTVAPAWPLPRATFCPATMTTPVSDARHWTRTGSTDGCGGGPAGRTPAEPGEVVRGQRVRAGPQQLSGVEVEEAQRLSVDADPDASLIGVVAASAGTATIETGVGFVTGWGIAAYEAYKIVEMADKARKLIATVSAVIGTVVGEIQAASASTGSLTKYPLPGGSYKHPGTPQP